MDKKESRMFTPDEKEKMKVIASNEVVSEETPTYEKKADDKEKESLRINAQRDTLITKADKISPKRTPRKYGKKDESEDKKETRRYGSSSKKEIPEETPR
jgi:hypothetical protein